MTTTLTPLAAKSEWQAGTDENIQARWQARLELELPQQPATTKTTILHWLLGEDGDRYHEVAGEPLEVLERAMDYRLRILTSRYLGKSSTQAYQHLMQRLGGLVVLRERIRAWLAVSRDRQRTVADVLQEVIQEMLHRDRYIKSQITWIGKCTRNPHLRDALLFASIEEYCLRPIRQRPLIVYRFANYLRSAQTSGITSIPQGELIKIVTDETIGDNDAAFSLLDLQAYEDYQQQQAWTETQLLRARVKKDLRAYLVERLGTSAGEWLDLYLAGKTPNEIAAAMGISVTRIYRLRDRIYYHATRVFAIKSNPELVSQWLQVSLHEHNLGLTSSQWSRFVTSLAPLQLEILTSLKTGIALDALGKSLQLPTNRIVGEWLQIYLAAQNIRTDRQQ